MLSWIRISSISLLFAALLVLPLQAQNTEQLEVGPPPPQRVDPPAPGASPEELENRGDELREGKNYLDAVDFYQAALKGAPGTPRCSIKSESANSRCTASRKPRKLWSAPSGPITSYADAYNNLGVVYYSLGVKLQRGDPRH